VNTVTEHEGVAARRTGTAGVWPREVLTFRLGPEEYAIDIMRVQEIRGYEAPTRLAGAPAFIRGVLNLRGVIVPVVDLRVKFGMDAHFDTVTATVILNILGRTLGTVVDSVSDVLELRADQIREAPEFNSAVDARHILGLATVSQGERDRMLILLDIEQLMSTADMGLVSAAHA
jgi:purine-binding chemotaxis protein CheW